MGLPGGLRKVVLISNNLDQKHLSFNSSFTETEKSAKIENLDVRMTTNF